MKRSYQSCFNVLACLFIAGCLMLGAMPFSHVFAAKGDLTSISSEKVEKPLEITLGKAELIGIGEDLSDVLVANPALIDVMAVQSDRLYIVGLQVGDTNIIALDEEGNVVKRLDIHVTYDLQAIQSKVNELFPEEDVTVSSIHDQIILTGTASNPEVASKITNLVGHYVSDLTDDEGSIDELISSFIEARGEQQVMLQVKIVEASRNALRELGVETDINDPDELAGFQVFDGTAPSSFLSEDNFLRSVGSIGLSQPALGAARFVGDTGLDGIGQIGVLLQALEEENLANILAEPNLTAVSGEQAGFLAGGEFPVPVGRDQVGNIIIEFREFGVALNFRPIVLSSQRINLQMDTEVSSLDFDNAIILEGLEIPGLDVRRAETTIEMASGKSLMIAGLLQSEAIQSMSGLPGISKTPILGDLVSSDGFERNETELIVIVTPYLVRPYQDKKVVESVPEKQRAYPLAKAFATNIRREFDADNDLFEGEGGFGYILD
ncbi:MAG: type II and III secretion system protein family protein [Bdellovibrionales bacterium]